MCWLIGSKVDQYLFTTFFLPETGVHFGLRTKCLTLIDNLASLIKHLEIDQLSDVWATSLRSFLSAVDAAIIDADEVFDRL